MDNTPPHLSPHLPAPLPDLIVVGQKDRWLIRRMSPRLAALAGLEVSEVQGRTLEGLFVSAVPALEELAREAASGDEPLTGILVRLTSPGQDATLALEVHPGGLAEDYRGREVRFFFSQPANRPVGPSVGDGLVGGSPAWHEVLRKIALYAPSDATVIITGETGTGKELVARALHDRSPRHGEAFVAVNCTAISEALLESELFGHEKGSFTGALRSHRGRFERADGGTLFLDEVGDMPLGTQAKLLRVLEEGRIERVGAEQDRPVDVRVLAATNVPLEQAVGSRRFRADLYHRLAVLRIHLPPLRERTEDIPLLVNHFLAAFNAQYGHRIQRLTSEALALLQSYLWPGNIRELRNVLERVYVETATEVIGARAFSEWLRERHDFLPGGWNLDAAGRRVSVPLVPQYPLATARTLLAGPPGPAVLDAEVVAERRHRHSTRPAELDADEIRKAFRAAHGNLAATARLLGVHRATLYRYLQRLRLTRDSLERT